MKQSKSKEHISNEVDDLKIYFNKEKNKPSSFGISTHKYLGILTGLAVAVLGAPSMSQAKYNRFDQMETFREVQTLTHIAGQKKQALQLGDKLLTQLDKSDPLFQPLNELTNSLNDGNPTYPLDKAVKFATGTKVEIYCRGQGLVHLIGNHNDGTKTEVKLIASNRKMGQEFAYITGGDWLYEMFTGYRTLTRSESWLDTSTSSSYSIQEFRKRAGGEFDEGKGTAQWQNGHVQNSYHTKGETHEPLPLYMANDFHLWGSYDLGFKIQFKLGYKDEMQARERGSTKVIVLKTKREVIEKLESYDFTDSERKTHLFQNCYKVKSNIDLDKLENP